MRKRTVFNGPALTAILLGGALFLMPGGPQIVTGPPPAAPGLRAPVTVPHAGNAGPGAPPAAQAPDRAAQTQPQTQPIAILLVPVEGVRKDDLRDNWGEARTQGRSHAALDIPAPRGTPVIAADSGRILKFFDSADGGTTIYQSDSTGNYVLYYAHLEARATGLSEGDAIPAGRIIGYVGTSGNAPDDAPHLHFEIVTAPEGGGWTGGTPINPYDALRR